MNVHYVILVETEHIIMKRGHTRLVLTHPRRSRLVHAKSLIFG